MFKETQSAGGIVLNKEGKILLISQHGTSWSLPKGHTEKGENKKQTVIREVYEESGLKDLEFLTEFPPYQRYCLDENGIEDRQERKTIYMFLIKTKETVLVPKDPENPEAIWVSIDEAVEKLTHPKDKEFLLSVKDKINNIY